MRPHWLWMLSFALCALAVPVQEPSVLRKILRCLPTLGAITSDSSRIWEVLRETAPDALKHSKSDHTIQDAIDSFAGCNAENKQFVESKEFQESANFVAYLTYTFFCFPGGVLDRACEVKLTRFFGRPLHHVSRRVIEDLMKEMCTTRDWINKSKGWSSANELTIIDMEATIEMASATLCDGEKAVTKWLENPEAGLENPPAAAGREVKPGEKVPDEAWLDVPVRERKAAPTGAAASAFKAPEDASPFSPERLKQVLSGISVAGVATQLGRLRGVPPSAPFRWAVQQLKPGMMYRN